MFIRIKNAQAAGHESVRFSYSQFKHEIVRALERGGFVGKAERKGKRIKKVLEVELISREKQSGLHGILLMSKPSRRMYTSYRELHPARRGGIILLSTPKGVMSGQEARKAKVGGQLIAEVW